MFLTIIVSPQYSISALINVIVRATWIAGEALKMEEGGQEPRTGTGKGMGSLREPRGRKAAPPTPSFQPGEICQTSNTE